jgi:hypothetical protein
LVTYYLDDNNRNKYFNSTYAASQAQILPKKYQADAVARAVDRAVSKKADKISDSKDLSQWLQDPLIRREASMQIQKMSISYNRKDNVASYQVILKEKQLEKMTRIYELFKEKMKQDPLMKVFLKYHFYRQD